MTRPDYLLTKFSKLRIDRPRVGGAEGLPRRAVQVAASSQKTFRLSPGFAAEQRKKPISVLCTDTRVEIPAIAEMIEGTLRRMRKCSQQHGLNIEANLLKPMYEESFWVNIIGRGYPPPNRTFRWCTQRMKIDPVNDFVKQRIGHWGEAILHLGARRAESSTRAQTMAGRQARNGLNRHPDLPRVWVSNPIQFLTTEEVWAYLLQNANPWGGDNRPLYKLYASASNGECPIQIDTSTPSCGNSRFGCWTCTVVDRDKASEGLLASGDGMPITSFHLVVQFRFMKAPKSAEVREGRGINLSACVSCTDVVKCGERHLDRRIHGGKKRQGEQGQSAKRCCGEGYNQFPVRAL
jgi:putative sulfurtransferase DndC